MPAAASTQMDLADPDSTPLRRLAQRVARNREVLGLHYPSDSAAGRYLGDQSAGLLTQCTSVKHLIPIAKQEWNNPLATV
jgi:membrane-associated phospholipid phosphatase